MIPGSLKSWLVLACATSLVACGENGDRQLARCELDAIKTYPKANFFTDAEPNNLIRICMAAEGFDFVPFSQACEANYQTHTSRESTPDCYETTGFWASVKKRLGSKFEF